MVDNWNGHDSSNCSLDFLKDLLIKKKKNGRRPRIPYHRNQRETEDSALFLIGFLLEVDITYSVIHKVKKDVKIEQNFLGR